MEFDQHYFSCNFRLAWQPVREKVKPFLLKRQRQLITLDKLYEIVGKKRADFIVKKCLQLKLDKKRFKVQNKGILDVYCK